jgi:alanine racemase
MKRIGFDADEPNYCEQLIRKYNGCLNLTGMFTHLCVADTERADAVEFTKQQIRKFENVAKRVEDLNLPYVHCFNSAGGLWHESPVSCFARVGIVLYGLKPNYMKQLPEGIKPALTWRTVISMVKTVHAGESIGYGRTYVANHDIQIATILTGYADGYNRMLSNKGYVLINGKKACIVGRICMDQFMVDVTEITDVNMGTEVILLGESENESFTADDMADMINTIGYEIVCNISKRVPRKYIDNL